MDKPIFILGSSSPRRFDLLGSIGIVPDKIISPDINEDPLKNETPLALVKRLSMEKNLALHGEYHGNIILTADTIVISRGRVLPKALCDEEFFYCMKMLSNRRHIVITSVSICDALGKMRHKTVKSTVKVGKLSQQDINDFHKTMQWHGKAGGYGLQGYFAKHIEFMSGSYSAIVGLPLCESLKMLKTAKYNFE